MASLFVFARAWSWVDDSSVVRMQAMDGEYTHVLSEAFHLGGSVGSVEMAITVARPEEYPFVARYSRDVDARIRVVALTPTLRGSLPTRLWGFLRNLTRAVPAVWRASHVVVFMSSLSATCVALLAKGLRRKLLVYSGNDWAVDISLQMRGAGSIRRRLATWVADKLETLVLRVAHARLLNSPKLFQKCQRLGGMSERVRPVSLFGLADIRNRDDTCKKDRIVIAYPGALIPRKNHLRLIEALALLRRWGLNAEVHLAGATESQEYLDQLIASARLLGIEPHLKYFGYLSSKAEMVDFLNSADIVVLCSLNEGFPRVVWEAMSQSIPCAVSRIPNIVAEIGDRDVVLMFNPMDPESIGLALHQIATNHEIRRGLIRASREYALEVFREDWRQQLTRVINAWR